MTLLRAPDVSKTPSVSESLRGRLKQADACGGGDPGPLLYPPYLLHRVIVTALAHEEADRLGQVRREDGHEEDGQKAHEREDAPSENGDHGYGDDRRKHPSEGEPRER